MGLNPRLRLQHGHRGRAAAETAVGTAQGGLEGLYTAWVRTNNVGGAETLGVGGLDLPTKKTSTGLTYTTRGSNRRVHTAKGTFLRNNVHQ